MIVWSDLPGVESSAWHLLSICSNGSKIHSLRELLPSLAHLQIGLCLRIGCAAALHKQQGPQDGEAKLESGELWQPAPAQLLVEQLIDVDVGFAWPEGLKAFQLSREQLMDLQSEVGRQHEL